MNRRSTLGLSGFGVHAKLAEGPHSLLMLRSVIKCTHGLLDAYSQELL